jgi:hypothetical protein
MLTAWSIALLEIYVQIYQQEIVMYYKDTFNWMAKDRKSDGAHDCTWREQWCSCAKTTFRNCRSSMTNKATRK